MNPFLKKLLIYFAIFLVILEIFSRIVIDPFYFFSIKTYNERKGLTLDKIYSKDESGKVDFLFIGSSRIPATINHQLIYKLSNGKVAINAGRGYLTPGIHYQALKSKLKDYPDFLKNSIVIIEYAGSDVYCTNFEDDRLKVYEPIVTTDVAMPHLLVPYLDFNSFIEFLIYSKNSFRIKLDLTMLYFSAFYRGCQYINEKYHIINVTLDKFLMKSNANNLAAEGGIRNDQIEAAKQKAINVANQEKQVIQNNPNLSNEIINKSTFAKIYELVNKNGGSLMLYKMPLHSIQKDIYNTKKAKQNQMVFEEWLKSKNIKILYDADFKFTDSDFPDTWHLALQRRDEFTERLYRQIMKGSNIKL